MSTIFDTVNVDDVAGARIAVHALFEAGHRNIKLLTLPPENLRGFDVSCHREAGYRQGMQEVGLADSASVVTSSLSAMTVDGASRTDIMADVLRRDATPVAYFCWSDLNAVPLIDAARALGLHVPQDVAVIGFDNTPFAALRSVDLASIDQGAHSRENWRPLCCSTGSGAGVKRGTSSFHHV